MNVIGITGSSGSGKSTVCDIFKQKYNVKIVGADEIADRLSIKGTNYIEDIAKEFGKGILDEQGNLKRKELAHIIYTNPEKREKLNKCTFKYITEEIKEEIEKQNDASTIIIDAPLLFEAKLEKICKLVIGVISTKDMQIQRIIKRDSISYEHAEKRINAQKANEFYKKMCDEIIENNGDILDIEKRIAEISKKYNITEKLQ